MKVILELRKKRSAKIQEARELLNTVEAESRDLTEEERGQYDALTAEAENLKTREEREVKVRGLEDEVGQLGQVDVGGHEEPHTPEPAGGFRSLGEQLQAVMHSSSPGAVMDQRLLEIQHRAPSGMGEGTPSEGGFLVQQDFVNTLLRRAYETGVLANRINRHPVSAAANGVRIPRIDESSRADGSRLGGVQAYWEAEADSTTASKPKIGVMELYLKKLMAVCYATDELLADTALLESIIAQAFAEEIGFKLDDAIFRGTGAGQPLGVMNANCLVGVNGETGQTADTVVAANISKMWARMWAKSRSRAVWLINQEIEPQLDELAIPVGTGGIPVYMPAGGMSDAPYGRLKGRPVMPIEQASALGDKGDISLVDLSQYMGIDKGGMQSAVSIHVRFLYDEKVFRFVYRFDGQPMWQSPLTPYKGASSLSPFVTLNARA